MNQRESWSEDRIEEIAIRPAVGVSNVECGFILITLALAQVATPWGDTLAFLCLLPAGGHFLRRYVTATRKRRTLTLSHSEVSLRERGEVVLAVHRSEIARAVFNDSLFRKSITLEFSTARPPYSIPLAFSNKALPALQEWLRPVRLENVSGLELWMIAGTALLAGITLLQSPTQSHRTNLIAIIGIGTFLIIIERTFKTTPDRTPVPISLIQVKQFGVHSEGTSETWFQYQTHSRIVNHRTIRTMSLGLALVPVALTIFLWATLPNSYLLVEATVGLLASVLLLWMVTSNSWLIRDWDITLRVKNGAVRLVDGNSTHPATLSHHWTGLTLLQTTDRQILLQPNLLVPVSPPEPLQIALTDTDIPTDIHA